MAITLDFDYDEKRQGYWIKGSGFDFFAYFTSDEESTFVECDHIQREGDEYVLHLQVRLGPAGKVHQDILETAVHNELKKWWS